LDGYGVLKLLSKNSTTAAIPFIFLTAKTEKDDFRKGMNLGADDYLTKPFDETDLIETIERRLKKSELLKGTQEGDGLANLYEVAPSIDPLLELTSDKKGLPYEKKETIYKEEDYAQYLYLLVSGKVKVFKEDEYAKELILDIISPGEYFGFKDLLIGNNRNESAAALEASEVIKIKKEDFENLMFKNREVAAKFIKLLAGNISEKEDKLLGLAYQSVRMRLKFALLELAESSAEKGSIKLNISRENLASMIGTSPETAIRTLSEFKSDNIVKIEKSAIIINNIEAIRNIKF